MGTGFSQLRMALVDGACKTLADPRVLTEPAAIAESVRTASEILTTEHGLAEIDALLKPFDHVQLNPGAFAQIDYSAKLRPNPHISRIPMPSAFLDFETVSGNALYRRIGEPSFPFQRLPVTIFITTGMHEEDYHRPTDDPQVIGHEMGHGLTALEYGSSSDAMLEAQADARAAKTAGILSSLIFPQGTRMQSTGTPSREDILGRRESFLEFAKRLITNPDQPPFLDPVSQELAYYSELEKGKEAKRNYQEMIDDKTGKTVGWRILNEKGERVVILYGQTGYSAYKENGFRALTGEEMSDNMTTFFLHAMASAIKPEDLPSLKDILTPDTIQRFESFKSLYWPDL